MELKLKKLQDLSSNDKEMIDVQRRKMQQMKTSQEKEIAKLLAKLKSLQRNYETLSDSTRQEKGEFIHYKQQAESLEVEVVKLKKTKNELEARDKDFLKQIERLITENKDLEAMLAMKQSEFKVQFEELRREKVKLEEKNESMTTQNKVLNESLNKTKQELGKKTEQLSHA